MKSLKDKVSYLETPEGSVPPVLYDELIIEALLSGRYSLTHYYNVIECVDYPDKDIKKYALTAKEKNNSDYMGIAYVYDGFILKLLDEFPPEKYLIEKLRQDVTFRYDPWEHSLTVKARAQFREKTFNDCL